MTIDEPGAPNLDCQPRSDLQLFIRTVKAGPRKAALAMFPSKPPRYQRATRDLLRYAELKNTAMAMRENGKVSAAMHYESACDAIYKRLPDFARW